MYQIIQKSNVWAILFQPNRWHNISLVATRFFIKRLKLISNTIFFSQLRTTNQVFVYKINIFDWRTFRHNKNLFLFPLYLPLRRHVIACNRQNPHYMIWLSFLCAKVFLSFSNFVIFVYIYNNSIKYIKISILKSNKKQQNNNNMEVNLKTILQSESRKKLVWVQ